MGDLGGDGNHNGGCERLGASNRVNSVREQEPPAVAFARLQKVKGILRESCSQYVRLDSDAPPDVQAYRVAFVSGENASYRIQQHWRNSMPGLGRLWYSLVFRWGTVPFLFATFGNGCFDLRRENFDGYTASRQVRRRARLLYR